MRKEAELTRTEETVSSRFREDKMECGLVCVECVVLLTAKVSLLETITRSWLEWRENLLRLSSN